MTDCGPILDMDGYLPGCFENLGSVLSLLFERSKLPKNRRRITVLVSTVCGSFSNPSRREIEKNYSFGYLCRRYKSLEGTDFDPKAHEIKSTKERDFRLAAYRKQGEKAGAWSAYGQYCHTQKLLKQEAVINSLPRQEQEVQRKKFEKENGPVVLRIG